MEIEGSRSAGPPVVAQTGSGLFHSRLDDLLLGSDLKDLREEIFKLILSMNTMTQRDMAMALARAVKVWSAGAHMLGNQSERLQALEDSLAIVCGLPGAASPLFGTTLPERPKVVWDDELFAALFAALRRGAAHKAHDCDSAIAVLLEEQAAVQSELQALQQELHEEGSDGAGELGGDDGQAPAVDWAAEAERLRAWRLRSKIAQAQRFKQRLCVRPPGQEAGRGDAGA